MQGTIWIQKEKGQTEFSSDPGPSKVYACQCPTHSLTTLLKVEWIDPKYADYAEYADCADYADYAD